MKSTAYELGLRFAKDGLEKKAIWGWAARAIPWALRAGVKGLPRAAVKTAPWWGKGLYWGGRVGMPVLRHGAVGAASIAPFAIAPRIWPGVFGGEGGAPFQLTPEQQAEYESQAAQQEAAFINRLKTALGAGKPSGSEINYL